MNYGIKIGKKRNMKCSISKAKDETGKNQKQRMRLVNLEGC